MRETLNPAQSLAKAAEVVEQLGVELAFVEAEQDVGLLPINSFVMDLEELVAAEAPAPIRTGLAAARGWLDQILDGSGKFSSDSIQKFNEWHPWMTSALTEWSQGKTPPEAPQTWSSGGIVPAPEKSQPSTASKVTQTPQEDEPAIRLNLGDDSELLREFHSESLELLQSIEQGLLVLETNPKDAGTINSVFRAFHTFKGGAGFLHLDALRDLAHELESLLDAARRSDLAITSDIINVILAGADGLKQYTREIGAQLQGENPGMPIVVPTRQLIRRVRAALRGDAAPAATTTSASVPTTVASTSRQPTSKSPALTEGATAGQNLPGATISTLTANSPLPDSASDVTAPAPDSTAKPATSDDSASSTARQLSAIADSASGFVKLDTRKLDILVDLVGELVIAQSMVVQNPDVQRLQSRSLARSLRQLGRITSELQRNAMSLRMVPIRGAFQKMTRLVRDLAAQQQKQAQLLLEGEETELDRNMVEKMADPLVHMIRNSVDHGIEPPEIRIAQGKPAQGTIRLAASHQRGGIVIRIQDDGKGLDRERILAKARERGLVRTNATLTESETFGLIFAPGFSTAEKVTDVSGRGVGMDVVRRNIEKLRGKIEIQSTPGHGTTFTVILPLTLAIIDGMLVGVGNDRYIIPTLSVRESFRPRPGMVSTVHERGEVVSVRGRLTPLLRLGQHLGTPARAVDPTDGIIVVVESGDFARGLLVDELIGKQEVVIKNLGETFKHQNLLAGAAILGDGRVGLILDVDTLVKCRINES